HEVLAELDLSETSLDLVLKVTDLDRLPFVRVAGGGTRAEVAAVVGDVAAVRMTLADVAPTADVAVGEPREEKSVSPSTRAPEIVRGERADDAIVLTGRDHRLVAP